MSSLVVFTEEASSKEVLNILLPKILPDGYRFQVFHFQGKSDLQKRVPAKIKAWRDASAKFLILQDQDSNDCVTLKQDLCTLCAPYEREILVRIACVELEAWYFGDLSAVDMAYNTKLANMSAKSKFREPDKIQNPKDELRKLIPTLQQIAGAKTIAPHMNVEANTSRSFQVFVSGVRKLTAE
ncbi:MAG: DUF4276 family protein [Oscillospiraceae bacterium]|nr:DUF4276 family protein [Oscillospiraceae bacterium]